MNPRLILPGVGDDKEINFLKLYHRVMPKRKSAEKPSEPMDVSLKADAKVYDGSSSPEKKFCFH
jgi:hypothetical protein